MAEALNFNFEIAGRLAMFMRPDSGATPVSFPIPTGSAIRAMVESVALVQGAAYVPLRIEVCNPVVYVSYACNYGGPLRKPDQIKKFTNYQHYARALFNPCFKVYGACVNHGASDVQNAPRKLQAMLQRRLQAGQSRFPAVLGWKEFAPSYFGEHRSTSAADTTVNETVEGYLAELWAEDGRWSPRFATISIRSGVCDLLGVRQYAS